ncbi:DDE-type integrase/transposase/recombinase [Microvirga sp. SYSU G3D207]|uniref:DDE-type integrase/transposase/recombinase n=1 Tax=Microvirga arsenatis TaxID=2692265 RepID=A0ABW9YVJ1_9HYPH|nr:DDE-type integrase/transposase/recombinase [Microvirga arsenatis]NBJ10689.1 DDE-type integrase/transposase/recombinase [Microvirga arsenatis]NBJ24413.1 DDE-type integrase/transposase/recombinase [Microvirga arsenatis]
MIGEKPTKKKFRAYPSGNFHMDIAVVRTEEERLYLKVAIDRASKFVLVKMHEKVTTAIGGDFLRALVKAVPYENHTVLTDYSIHFTPPCNTASAAPLTKNATHRGELFRAHASEYVCVRTDVDHSLTRPRHPWTNGQVERIN